jgi:hypothetical protein
MSFAKLAGENPFLLWVLSLNDVGALDIKGGGPSGAKDIILGAQGSRRFGLAAFPEGIPYLGYVDTDKAAIEAVKWTSAAILFRKGGQDWVALSTTDARLDTAQAMNPVPLRLFIPVATGRLSAWREVAPKELAIGVMTLNGKGETVFSGSPFKKLPLKIG